MQLDDSAAFQLLPANVPYGLCPIPTASNTPAYSFDAYSDAT